MMMMVLVSKQHKVTTKYKMPIKTHFAPYLSVGRRHHTKCRGSRFSCRASVFFKSLALQDE